MSLKVRTISLHVFQKSTCIVFKYTGFFNVLIVLKKNSMAILIQNDLVNVVTATLNQQCLIDYKKKKKLFLC